MKARFLVGLAAGVFGAGANAEIPTYISIQLQARTNLLVNDEGYNLPPGSSFNSISAAIDPQGHVAFPVQIVPDGGASKPGVWYGGNGAGGIVSLGPADALISSSVALGDDGKIAFVLNETPTSEDGIYRYDPSTQAAARVGTGPVFPNSYGSVNMNASGRIGFQAVFSSGRAFASIGTTGGGAFHAQDRGLDPGSAYTYLYTPSLNGEGRIVGKVATSADLTSATQVRGFLPDGTSVLYASNQGSDAGSPIRQFDNSVGVARTQYVAFVGARVADNRRAVWRVPASPLAPLVAVDPAGTVRDIAFFPPAVNSAGLVVFRGRDANGEAIFLADGTSVVRLAGKGDRLQTDLGLAQIGQNNETDSVFSGAPSINDNGDVVFIAALHPDGNNQAEWGTGVFVAHVSRDLIFADGFEQASP